MEIPVFAGKRVVTVGVTTREFNLGFDERCVYSLLCYLEQYGKPVAVGRLVKVLDPSIRVQHALTRLVENRLVTWGDIGVRAVEPKGKIRSWFSWQTPGTETKPWHRSFRFLVTYLPAAGCPITYRQYFLYLSLASIAEDGLAAAQSRHGLEGLTRITRPTISDAIETLQGRGLVDYIEDDGFLHFMVNEGLRAEWFLDKKTGKVFDRDAILAKIAAKSPIAARSDFTSEKTDAASKYQTLQVEESEKVGVPKTCKFGMIIPVEMGNLKVKDTAIATGPAGQVALPDGPPRDGEPPADREPRYPRLPVTEQERSDLRRAFEERGWGEDLCGVYLDKLGHALLPSCGEWSRLIDRAKDFDHLTELVKSHFFANMANWDSP